MSTLQFQLLAVCAGYLFITAYLQYLVSPRHLGVHRQVSGGSTFFCRQASHYRSELLAAIIQRDLFFRGLAWILTALFGVLGGAVLGDSVDSIALDSMSSGV